MARPTTANLSLAREHQAFVELFALALAAFDPHIPADALDPVAAAEAKIVETEFNLLRSKVIDLRKKQGFKRFIEVSKYDAIYDSNSWQPRAWDSFRRTFREPYGAYHVTPALAGDFLYFARVLVHHFTTNADTTEKGQLAKRIFSDPRYRFNDLAYDLFFKPKLSDSPIRSATTRRFIREKLKELALSRRSPDVVGRVPLTFSTDCDESKEAAHRLEKRYEKIEILLSALAPFPITVLLGKPGAGKTTLLREIEVLLLDSSDMSERSAVPLFISLTTFTGNESIEDWLSQQWESTYGTEMPDFSQMRIYGLVFLILDGFNELPSEEMERWSHFLSISFTSVTGNRAILTCRQQDYSVPVGLGQAVPHIGIASMDAQQIRASLMLYRPKDGFELWKRIRGAKAEEFYGVPLFLRMLAEVVDDATEISLAAPELFHRFIWRLLREQLGKDHQSFADPVLTHFDRRSLANNKDLPHPIRLPEGGLLTRILTDLAFRMERITAIPIQVAFAHLSDYGREEVDQTLKAAQDASLLQIDGRTLTLSFYHPLLQEFFIARRIAREFNDELWQLKSFPPIDLVAQAESIALLPWTGWEEATIMAASLASDRDAFVGRVFVQNPFLAARCAASIAVSPDLDVEIQTRMVEIFRDESADIRARIQAGNSINDLSPLGYEPRSIGGTKVLIPPMAEVPAGNYPLGVASSFLEDIKFHAVKPSLNPQIHHIDSFQIGVYHVTNAEFACFIAAGGYEDERWWPTDAANRWRNGEEDGRGLQQSHDIAKHREWGQAIGREVGTRWMPDEADFMVERTTWTQAKREEELQKERDEVGIPRYPEFWLDSTFNSPAQPVIGVTWYEASAYCAWLSAMTGLEYRLLADEEHEAAARGFEGRTYAYGDVCDTTRCNIHASKIWRTTPVGLYGRLGENGPCDLTGNAWTWTSSLDFPNAEGNVPTCVRGGSYDTAPLLARSFLRDSNFRGYRDRYIGFRLARSV